MIVIIGSGLAGYTLAREFRKLDQVTPIQILTKDDGTYYSKPQLSSAFSHQKTAQALGSFPAEKMAAQLKAEIFNNSLVTSIDPKLQTITANNKTFAYSQLILAQGAEVVKTPLTGNAAEKAISINNLQDYIKFRELVANKKRIAIIGAGLVGCEFTNDLINGGYEVDVIALASTPLDILLPPELGMVLRKSFAEKGVRWHLENSITSVDHADEELLITLNDGEQIQTDILISAIGLRPALQLAATAEIACNRGIKVDRHLQTNVKNIYAIGDCAEVEGHVMFYVAPLVTCARALAHTLAGTLTAVSYPPMPVVLKTPACPIVVNPPPKNMQGQWQFSGEGLNQKGLFYDANNQLQGFALLGNTVVEKMELVKELPNIF